VTGPAKACSCSPEDARTQLSRVPAAFIGVFLEKEPAEPDPGDEVEYRFRVDEAIKGDLGKRVTIVAQHSPNVSCGIGTPGPEQLGWLLERHDEGRWRASGCATTMEPDALRAAARPLPAPDGRGPPAFLLGGSFGDVRTIALDGEGHTLAYGGGAPHTRAIGVCPGSSRALELSAPYDGPTVLSVRRLPDLGVVRDVPLPGQPFSAVAVRCVDPDGENAYISTVEGQSYDAQTTSIVRVRGRTLTTLWSGAARSATFSADADLAYLARADGDGTVAEKVDLATGRVSRLGRVVGRAESFVPERSRRWLATTVQSNSPTAATAEVVLFDLRRPLAAPRSAALESLGGPPVLWAGSKLVVTGHGDMVRVYDTDLRRLSAWGPWYAQSQVVVGDVLYGTSWSDEVFAGALGTGPKRTLTRRPGLLGAVLTHVPPSPPSAPAPVPTTGPPPPETTTTEVTTSTTTSTTTAEAVVAAAPASTGRDAGGGLLALGLAMWLGAASGSVLVRRRWAPR
jgi:hypothetical protein